jgi:dGTPase
MADRLKLLSYQGDRSVRMRHPLAFLVEAADDICYSIIDLEDGHQLGLVSYQQTEELLAAILKDGFQPEKLHKMNGDAERVGVLRALAINKLVDESAEMFLQHESEILSGEFDTALTDIIDSKNTLQKISAISVQRIYRSQQVLQREAAGFEVLDGIMEAFTKAVYFSFEEPAQVTSRHKNIIRLLPEEYQANLKAAETLYQRLLIITDFVSGITDSAALNFFQTIKGISLPGIK